MMPRWKRRKYARRAVLAILVLFFVLAVFLLVSSFSKETQSTGVGTVFFFKAITALFWFCLGFFAWRLFRKG